MYKDKELFTGQLDNVSTKDIINMLDFNKHELKERLTLVEELLENTEFFIEYFSEKYNPNAGTETPLAENNNVCKLLETIGTYILNSREVVEENRKNKTQYLFVTNQSWFKTKMDREISIQELSANQYGECRELIPFLLQKEKNYKKQIVTKIYQKDLQREDELGRILNEYQSFLSNVEDRLRSKRVEDKGKRYLLTRACGSLREDMKYTKDSLLGTFRLKMKGFQETTEYNILDAIDFTQIKHIKALLKMKSEGLEPDNDLSVLLYDFNNIVKESNLTEKEKEVVEFMQQGMTTTEIAREYKVTKQAVSKWQGNIAKKIQKRAIEDKKMFGKY